MPKEEDSYVTQKFCTNQHEHFAKEIDLEIELAKREILGEMKTMQEKRTDQAKLSWQSKAAIIGSVIVSISAIIVALIEKLL
jgi:hypothetical protein